jgi:uncharacterized membrane protein
MNTITTADINADMSMLMGSFSSETRRIPSSAALFKISTAVPLIALVLSMLSDIIGYISLYKSESSVGGFYDYLLSDGWAVLLPTAIIGLLFTFMSYNNLMMYMAVPEDARRKSLVLSHLKKVAQRTVFIFLTLMVLAAVFSGIISWLAFGIPLLLFILLFAVNLVVGAEINRLGAGIALEKISKLINKI